MVGKCRWGKISTRAKFINKSMFYQIVMRELSVLAKYPFLNDTKTYIKEYGPSVKELLEDVLYERARSIGIERLDNALKKKNVDNRSLATESDCIMEILSYPLARMVTVCVGDTYFKRRYAFGEASYAYRNLLNEPISFLLDISKELHLNVEHVGESNKIKIFFKDYLRYAPTKYKAKNLSVQLTSSSSRNPSITALSLYLLKAT